MYSVATAGTSGMTIQKVKRLFRIAFINNRRSAQPRCHRPLRVEPLPLHRERGETGIEMTSSGSSSPGTVSTYSHANENHQIANGQYDQQKESRFEARSENAEWNKPMTNDECSRGQANLWTFKDCESNHPSHHLRSKSSLRSPSITRNSIVQE